jgi:hypothetical protein
VLRETSSRDQKKTHSEAREIGILEKSTSRSSSNHGKRKHSENETLWCNMTIAIILVYSDFSANFYLFCNAVSMLLENNSERQISGSQTFDFYKNDTFLNRINQAC